MSVGKAEIWHGEYTPGNTLVLRSHSAKKNCASIAGAQQLAALRFNQMGMFRSNFGAAQLATFSRSFAPHELAKRTECILVSRLNFIHHQVTNNSHYPAIACRAAPAITPPSFPRGTKPDEPACSSSPSISKPLMSGAASYSASSTIALRVLPVEPHACPVTRRCKPDRTALDPNQIQFASAFVHPRTNFFHRLRYATFQIQGMKTVQNQKAADQRIAAQIVDGVQSCLAALWRQFPSLAQNRRRASPAPIAPTLSRWPWPLDQRYSPVHRPIGRCAGSSSGNLCHPP